MNPGYIALLFSLFAAAVLVALQGFAHQADPAALASLTAAGGVFVLFARHFLRAVIDAAMDRDEH